MKKILIIDDDRSIVEFVSLTLRRANYEIFVAFNGDAGIDTAERCQPDLVIVDLLMPGMHGFDVCEKLLEDHPGLKIIHELLGMEVSEATSNAA